MAKEKARELVDLEVEEVSIVDRPANKRKFLIVKNEGTMPISDDGTITIELDEGIFDLVDSAIEKDDQLKGLHEIFKADTIAEATKILDPLLQNLMVVVKAAEENELDTKRIKAIANGLSLLVGGEIEITKSEDNPVQIATSALEQLMPVVKNLQETDDTDTGSQVSDEAITTIKTVAGSLLGLCGEAVEKKEEGNDPITIIKAGAKMRRSRLSQLRQAVSTLQALLKELEQSEMAKDNKKEPKTEVGKKEPKTEVGKKEPKTEVGKKEPTKPEEKEPAVKTDEKEPKVAKDEGSKAVVESLDKLTKAVEKLTADQAEIKKRVDGMDNTRPAGEGDYDPETSEKVEKKQSLWAGIV